MPELMRVISVTDEALDVAALPDGHFDEYVRRRDYALIEPFIKPGVLPTVYVLREIPHRTFSHVLSQASEGQRQMAAFQCALVRVENFRTDEGAIVMLNEQGFARYGKDTSLPNVLKDEELENFGHDELLEIGEVAFTRSFFRKRTARVYQLPHTWRARLVAQALLHAEPSRALPASSSDEPSSTTPSGGSSSASPTDATAPERSQQGAA